MDTTTLSSKENLINAIIIGGTGATGKKLIHQLLNNNNCIKLLQ